MINKILKLKKNLLNKWARKTKAAFRTARKVSTDILFEALVFISSQKEFSYNNISEYIYKTHKIKITKQALWNRVSNPGLVELLKEIVEKKVLNQLKPTTKTFKIISKSFKRILIQDSTIIKLPLHLYELFSGGKNGSTIVANARVQFTYDILNKVFVSFSVDSYSKNDLKAAPEIQVIGDDLWLRDRGYSSQEAIMKIIENAGDLIIRYKHKTNIYDMKGNAIDLAKLLRKNSNLNLLVRVGKNKIPMRIVSQKVDKSIADERRRKSNHELKKSRNGKRSMTKEYSFLCGFTILLSSIKKKLSFNRIHAIYSLRWRIETIFKAWKSNLNFANIHRVSKDQFLVLMYCRLITNFIVFTKFYNAFLDPIIKKENKILSIMALTKRLITNFQYYLNCLLTKKIDHLICIFSKFCTYEKRSDRKNYYEKEQAVFKEIKGILLK